MIKKTHISKHLMEPNTVNVPLMQRQWGAEHQAPLTRTLNKQNPNRPCHNFVSPCCGPDTACYLNCLLGFNLLEFPKLFEIFRQATTTGLEKIENCPGVG